MDRLYKYLPVQYAQSFIRNGAVLFRSLSYFRDYEDEQVRGDQFEGTRIHRPKKGLEITLTANQENIVLPHSFESSTNEEDIFVFCLSTILSPALAAEFQASACIEIRNPAKFIGGIRAAILRRPSIKNKLLVHGEVKYYTPDQPPIVDWALPERIAMSKRSTFSSQHEYRLAFAVNDAFRVENTRLHLVSPEERRQLYPKPHEERLFKIGNLASICKIHRFG